VATSRLYVLCIVICVRRRPGAPARPPFPYTTLFRSGANQHVGNFPGVTVDRKSGTIRDHENTLVTDLPGIYSLSPYTNEEIVSRSEEHTSELQSRFDLVCRLLLAKKKETMQQQRYNY